MTKPLFGIVIVINIYLTRAKSEALINKFII